MSTHFTVRQFGQVAPEHRATLASLPAILRPADAGTPDIALTASDPEAIRDALSASPKALVVAEPGTINDADVRRLFDASPLVFPALTLVSSLRQIDVGSVPSKAGFIHSRLAWQGEIKAAILEHLVGLSRVLGGLSNVNVLSLASGGYVGSAKTTDGAEVAWSGLAGAPSSHYELDIVGLTDRLEVRAELDGSARPMVVRRGHIGGLDQPIGVYETGLRLFWRSVADALASGEPTPEWKDIAGLLELAGKFASLAYVPNGDAA